jgi:hypothetical protein
MKPTEQRPEPYSPVRRLGSAAVAISRAAIGVTLERRRPAGNAVPFNQWPKWAKDIATDRQLGDVGVGDTVVHIIGDTRLETFKNWFTEHLGGSCGCTERQTWLNQRFPYL